MDHPPPTLVSATVTARAVYGDGPEPPGMLDVLLTCLPLLHHRIIISVDIRVHRGVSPVSVMTQIPTTVLCIYSTSILNFSDSSPMFQYGTALLGDHACHAETQKEIACMLFGWA